MSPNWRENGAGSREKAQAWQFAGVHFECFSKMAMPGVCGDGHCIVTTPGNRLRREDEWLRLNYLRVGCMHVNSPPQK